MTVTAASGARDGKSIVQNSEGNNGLSGRPGGVRELSGDNQRIKSEAMDGIQEIIVIKYAVIRCPESWLQTGI